MEERKQFTFYSSFASALSRIRTKEDRCDAYDAICNYALYGDEPDMDALSDAAAIAFELIKPVLDTSKRKAESGKRGGKAEANSKQSESKDEANSKQSGREKEVEKEKEGEKEVEKEVEKEKENECYINTSFDAFWRAYPKKVGKAAARKAFSKVKVPVDVLLSAIDQQKQSKQWMKDNGQYIPNPATWLNQGRWDDELDDNVTPIYSAKRDPDYAEKLARMKRMNEHLHSEDDDMRDLRGLRSRLGLEK